MNLGGVKTHILQNAERASALHKVGESVFEHRDRIGVHIGVRDELG
jgi:hypothetical protein